MTATATTIQRTIEELDIRNVDSVADAKSQTPKCRYANLKEVLCNRHNATHTEHSDYNAHISKRNLSIESKQALLLGTSAEDIAIVANKIREVVASTPSMPNLGLECASIIVSAGYGVGTKEYFELLRELAQRIHGEIGSTRAAVDAGICDRSTMIGQTGVSIRPKLYIAVGISGQTQHTAGIRHADTIISINKNADAAMNRIADYAVIGDAEVVLRELTAQLSK